MQPSVIITSAIGFLLSLYAVHVEKKSRKGNFKAVCDINDKFSCSKTFTSGYGKLFFGISNGTMGMFFYILVILLSFFNFQSYIFYLAVASVIGSVYLAYVLHFKVKTICVVCYSIYAVNLLLLLFSYYNI